MARRRTFAEYVAVALALHAVGLVTIARTRTMSKSVSPLSPLTVEIDLGPGDPATSLPAPPTRVPEAAPGAPRAAVARFRVGSASRALPALPAPAPSETAPDTERVDPLPGQGDDAPRLGLDQLGVGRKNPWLAQRFDSAPDRHPNAAPGVERSMATAQAEHDARIGLGPQGPVVGALEVATRAGAGPMNGRALFAATVDGSGKLVAIEVVEVSEAFPAWQAIAKRAAASLARRKLAKPAGGRAVRLAIEVTAREQMPSGADPGLAIDIAGVPLKNGKGKRSARISILPLPKAQIIDVPTPDGKYSSPWVTPPIPGIALAGDLADLGAKSRRMVHAHLVSTTVL